jgi:hypothetical protein
MLTNWKNRSFSVKNLLLIFPDKWEVSLANCIMLVPAITTTPFIGLEYMQLDVLVFLHIWVAIVKTTYNQVYIYTLYTGLLKV